MDIETTWNTHRDAVRRFIASRLDDRAMVDDILHEVYLKAKERFQQLRDPQKANSWLLKIAQNAIVDDGRRRQVLDPFSEETAQPNSCDAAEAWTKISDCVIPFIQNLEAGYRDALMLSAIDGHDDKEVARRMGLSLSATKSRIARAKKMVKDQFDECSIFNIDARQAIIESDTFGKSCDNDPCSEDDEPLYADE